MCDPTIYVNITHIVVAAFFLMMYDQSQREERRGRRSTVNLEGAGKDYGVGII